VHVSAGEVKLVTVLMHSNQLMWAGLDLGLSPVQPNNGGPGPAWQKKNIYAILFKYRSVFYVVKNINPVLKYPVFVNLKKKIEKIFLCRRPSVSKLKNHIVFFIHQKNNVLTCILALITRLLKSREHWPKYQKQKKNILCCFSIRDYEFIRKTYSRY